MSKVSQLFFLTLGFIIVCIFLPLLMSTFLHFDFITNYSVGSFSIAEFNKTYYVGVYKYRVLGRVLFLQFYHLITFLNAHGIVLHHISTFTLNRLGYHTEANYYLTQYFNDTVFLVLIAMMLFCLFSQKYYQFSNAQRNLTIVSIISMIAVSQFVLTVYDGLYYFISIAALFFILKDVYSGSKTAFLGVALMMVLGALTIEHSVLILSMYAFAYYDKYGLRFRKSLYKLVILIVLFFIPYIALRYVYGFNHAVYDILAGQLNMHFLYLTGLSVLFLVTGCFICVGNGEQLKRVLIFLFFSIPYIVAIFSFAYLAEVRVWLPVIIPAICFALLRPRKELVLV